jgi:hypothetical protein
VALLTQKFARDHTVEAGVKLTSIVQLPPGASVDPTQPSLVKSNASAWVRVGSNVRTRPVGLQVERPAGVRVIG